MRTVFLDIDGVLNAEPRIKNVHDPIVPEFVDQINLIHSKITDVQYVIVSAWAGKGLDYITTKLHDGGFTGTMHVDWVAEYPYSNAIRGDRVARFIEELEDTLLSSPTKTWSTKEVCEEEPVKKYLLAKNRTTLEAIVRDLDLTKNKIIHFPCEILLVESSTREYVVSQTLMRSIKSFSLNFTSPEITWDENYYIEMTCDLSMKPLLPLLKDDRFTVQFNIGEFVNHINLSSLNSFYTVVNSRPVISYYNDKISFKFTSKYVITGMTEDGPYKFTDTCQEDISSIEQYLREYVSGTFNRDYNTTDLDWMNDHLMINQDPPPCRPDNVLTTMDYTPTKYVEPESIKSTDLYRQMANPFISLYSKILMKNIFLKWRYDEYLNRTLFNLLNTKLIKISVGDTKSTLYFDDEVKLVLSGSLTRRYGTPHINDMGYGSISKKGREIYSWSRKRPCAFIMCYLLKLIYSVDHTSMTDDK